MRSKRVGSSAVDPGSTSETPFFGGWAMATWSLFRLRIPRDLRTSSGTRSVWGLPSTRSTLRRSLAGVVLACASPRSQPIGSTPLTAMPPTTSMVIKSSMRTDAMRLPQVGGAMTVVVVDGDGNEWS